MSAQPIEQEVAGPAFTDPDAFARTAAEKTTVAIMMIDRDFQVTYVNDATRALLAENGELFRKVFPRADFDNLIGASIDIFHKNPTHQRQLLAKPLSQPHKAEITIGELRFSLLVNSVIDGAGEYVGNVLEWNNVHRDQEGVRHAGRPEPRRRRHRVLAGRPGSWPPTATSCRPVGYRLEGDP